MTEHCSAHASGRKIKRNNRKQNNRFGVSKKFISLYPLKIPGLTLRLLPFSPL
jgi:hypothetical protein